MATEFDKDFLSDLISAGSDAQANLYYATVTDTSTTTVATFEPDKDKSEEENNKARQEFEKTENEKLTSARDFFLVRLKDFTPPKFTQKTNPIKFMTVGMEMPMVSISGPKEIKLTFRLDSKYEILSKLEAFRKKTLDLNNSAAGFYNNDSGLTVEVFCGSPAIASQTTSVIGASAATSNFKSIYKFENCWIKEISAPSFSYQQANALEVSATFGYYNFTDPTKTHSTKLTTT